MSLQKALALEYPAFSQTAGKLRTGQSDAARLVLLCPQYVESTLAARLTARPKLNFQRLTSPQQPHEHHFPVLSLCPVANNLGKINVRELEPDQAARKLRVDNGLGLLTDLDHNSNSRR